MSRSKWKPLFSNEKSINFDKKINKIYERNAIITEKYIDHTFQIYNGTRFFEVIVTKNMVGQKFGEFAPSKIKPIHKKKK